MKRPMKIQVTFEMIKTTVPAEIAELEGEEWVEAINDWLKQRFPNLDFSWERLT